MEDIEDKNKYLRAKKYLIASSKIVKLQERLKHNKKKLLRLSNNKKILPQPMLVLRANNN